MEKHTFFCEPKPTNEGSALAGREITPDFTGVQFPSDLRRREIRFVIGEVTTLAQNASIEAAEACKAAEMAARMHPGNRILTTDWGFYFDFPAAEFGTPERAAEWDANSAALPSCLPEHVHYRRGLQDAMLAAARANRTYAKAHTAFLAARTVEQAFRKTAK